MLFVSVLPSIIIMLLNCSFFPKRLQNVTSFLSFISTQKRKLEAEKLEKFLDSHCNLSQATQILFNNPSAVSSVTIYEE